ncbi:MAG: transporter [Deltaproteobacteria bacterium]|nr:transporter [Deltaproteobacteria bacterium]
MRKTIIFFILLFLSFTFAGEINACDFCLISQGISPLDTVKGSGVRINERYTKLTTPYHGTEKLEIGAEAKEEFWTTELTAFYSVTDDLTVMGVVPYRKTAMDGHLHVHADGAAEVHTDMAGDERGIGDVALMGRYSFFREHALESTTTVAGLIGVKLPTGKTDGTTKDGSEFLDAHLQLGTGSTDILLGLSASHSRANLSISANLLGAITTEGEAGAVTHEFGDMLNYDITAKYRVNSATPGLFVALGLNGELRQREKEDGVEVENSGGHTVYISPGLQVAASERLIIELSYQHAVYHNLYGTQLGEDFKASGGVTYLF